MPTSEQLAETRAALSLEKSRADEAERWLRRLKNEVADLVEEAINDLEGMR